MYICACSRYVLREYLNCVPMYHAFYCACLGYPHKVKMVLCKCCQATMLLILSLCGGGALIKYVCFQVWDPVRNVQLQPIRVCWYVPVVSSTVYIVQ